MSQKNLNLKNQSQELTSHRNELNLKCQQFEERIKDGEKVEILLSKKEYISQLESLKNEQVEMKPKDSLIDFQISEQKQKQILYSISTLSPQIKETEFDVSLFHSFFF